MRINDRVTYCAPDGSTSPSVVQGVGGSTPSLWKILDLRVGDVVVSDVAHEGDQSPGEGAWAFPEATESQVIPEQPSADEQTQTEPEASQDEAPHAPQDESQAQEFQN